MRSNPFKTGPSKTSGSLTDFLLKTTIRLPIFMVGLVLYTSDRMRHRTRNWIPARKTKGFHPAAFAGPPGHIPPFSAHAQADPAVILGRNPHGPKIFVRE